MIIEPVAVKTSIRQRVYDFLESENSTPAARGFAIFIGVLIAANVVAIFLESHAEFKAANSAALELFERVSIAIFLAEYVMRVWVSVENPAFASMSQWQARRKYLVSPMAGIDFLSFAPSLFALTGLVQWDLRILRTLRLLRLMKLARYFRTLDVFFSVIRSQVANLLGTLLIIVILLIISSSLMYSIEYDPISSKDGFESITETLWWSVVTLTSVGYGNVVPTTEFGRIIGGFIMLLGVGLVALPAAILGGKFADELQVRREKISQLAKEILRDGKIDAQEKNELRESGRDEGLSDDEIDKIAVSVKKSVEEFPTCPKCGYTNSTRE